MKRAHLDHVLRAAAAITGDNSFVVLGSQSVLLSFPDAPDDLLMSNEVDLDPAMHPERSDLTDGSLGELSMFHDTFGYFADGVGPDTAVMPADWMTFAQLHDLGDTAIICPDLHDIAVSKCVAGRKKDAVRVSALLRHRMILPARLLERIAALDAALLPLERCLAWAQRRIDEATP